MELVINFFLSLILTVQPAASYSERIYTVDKPLKRMVESLINDSHGDGTVTIPDLIKKAPVFVQTSFYPNKRYYKTEIQLLEPVDKVLYAWKTLEIWAKDNQTIVRSRIYLEIKTNHFPARFINHIKRRILCEIECKVLDVEERAIRNIGKDK
jgi:hypothetical protein